MAESTHVFSMEADLESTVGHTAPPPESTSTSRSIPVTAPQTTSASTAIDDDSLELPGFDPLPTQDDLADYSSYRIRSLETRLNDPSTWESQKPNLRLAIEMYRNGELPKLDGLIFFQHGRVVERKDLDPKELYWWEVGRQLLIDHSLC